MIRPSIRLALSAALLIAAGGGVRAGDDRPRLTPTATPAATSESSHFFHSYLAPRMSSRLGSTRPAVDADFATPGANPWTRADDTEDRVRRGAIRATKGALKKYALERLNLTGWSLPLGSGHGRGVAAFRTESGGPRLRFGISHLAPRAEALIPLDHGRMSVSADVMGRLGTSYETTSGRLRLGAYVDPREHSATAGLTLAF